MNIQTPVERDKIRALNDLFRKTFIGGVLVMTRGVAALPESIRYQIFYEVKAFNKFDDGNDPHEEHDFGSFDLLGNKFMWKIDYYDRTMEMGSPDPADAYLTKRVLTIMQASEY